MPTIAINSNVRFPTLKALQRKAQALNWVGFAHAQDDRGFYATAVELDPQIAAMLDAQDAKARENRLKREAEEAANPKPVVVKPETDKPKSASAIVLELMKAHPEYDMGAIVTLAVEQGVNAVTARTRFGDYRREGRA